MTRGPLFVPHFTRPAAEFKGGLASRIGVTATPILTTLFKALCTTARGIIAVQ
jgi:hypothetical protein